jgi:transcriptional regulator with XRE-family HTH domain
MDRMPVIDLPATGLNILRLRVRAGLTVRELQELFGFGTPQAIYKWQRGDTLPTVDNLAALAALFGVKIDDILVYQEDRGAAVSA